MIQLKSALEPFHVSIETRHGLLPVDLFTQSRFSLASKTRIALMPNTNRTPPIKQRSVQGVI